MNTSENNNAAGAANTEQQPGAFVHADDEDGWIILFCPHCHEGMEVNARIGLARCEKCSRTFEQDGGKYFDHVPYEQWNAAQGEGQRMNEPRYSKHDPEFQEWLKRNDPEPPQVGAEDLAAHRASDCVLCPTADIHEGGGIFWTDDKWICGPCWRGVAESRERAIQQARELNSRPIDTRDCPF